MRAHPEAVNRPSAGARARGPTRSGSYHRFSSRSVLLPKDGRSRVALDPTRGHPKPGPTSRPGALSACEGPISPWSGTTRTGPFFRTPSTQTPESSMITSTDRPQVDSGKDEPNGPSSSTSFPKRSQREPSGRPRLGGETLIPDEPNDPGEAPPKTNPTPSADHPRSRTNPGHVARPALQHEPKPGRPFAKKRSQHRKVSGPTTRPPASVPRARDDGRRELYPIDSLVEAIGKHTISPRLAESRPIRVGRGDLDPPDVAPCGRSRAAQPGVGVQGAATKLNAWNG